jgi:hypothetical protein
LKGIKRGDFLRHGHCPLCLAGGPAIVVREGEVLYSNGIQARVAYKHQAVRWGEFLLVFVAEAVLFLVALGAVVAAWQLAA